MKLDQLRVYDLKSGSTVYVKKPPLPLALGVDDEGRTYVIGTDYKVYVCDREKKDPDVYSFPSPFYGKAEVEVEGDKALI